MVVNIRAQIFRAAYSVLAGRCLHARLIACNTVSIHLQL